MKENEDLRARMNLLQQKEEMREARYHDEESQGSFNSIYGEADAFVRKIGINPTRPFGELDKAIANSGPAGSETRNAFLRSLPETDRQAWELAIPLLNKYGKVVEIPTNGGNAKTVRFDKYGNIDSLEDLYKLELLKSGKLNEKQNEAILAAHRQGAQSVIDSTKQPPGVKGLSDTALTGEKLPVETSLDEKKARLKTLMGMGRDLMKDRKLYDEYKNLSAEVHRNVKSLMAQGKFNRKK
jgi:hypothetical protein